jgi:pyruvate/2-oxoglutarate dehydrogenase complex dihydrolipoamide acyltransferase (E2) component
MIEEPSMKKNFAFQNDVALIVSLFAAGLSPADISDQTNIEQQLVEDLDPAKVSAVEEEPVEFLASDAAAKLAYDNGVDLALVTGTGANGNITKGDVEAFIAARDEGGE